MDPAQATTVIRRAREDDAPALAGFIRALHMFQRFESESFETTAERLTRHLTQCMADDSHTVLVAELGGVLVGYASVHWLPYLILKGPEGLLSELFVAAEHRGVGVGTSLLTAVVEEGRKRGCARLMLEAVRSRESYIRGFYTQRGWVERPDMANFVYQYE
jgi:GNAT superfamily N-acetyltransferase